MKKLIVSIVLLSACLLCGSQTASATTFVNPDPSRFANDDGKELFAPSQALFSIKAYDLLNNLGYQTTFGFFFEAAPNTLIPIFTSEDVGTGHRAMVDFGAGKIIDLDQEIVRNNAFSGSGNVGFYLNLAPLDLTLYSVANLNHGLDTVATYPIWGMQSAYLLEFAVPDHVLSLEIVDFANAVPEPSSILLVACGLGTFVICRIRRGGPRSTVLH